MKKLFFRSFVFLFTTIQIGWSADLSCDSLTTVLPKFPLQGSSSALFTATPTALALSASKERKDDSEAVPVLKGQLNQVIEAIEQAIYQRNTGRQDDEKVTKTSAGLFLSFLNDLRSTPSEPTALREALETLQLTRKTIIERFY